MKLTIEDARLAYVKAQRLGGDETPHLPNPAWAKVFAIEAGLATPHRESDRRLQGVAQEHAGPDGTIRNMLAFRRAEREVLDTEIEIQVRPLKASDFGDRLYDFNPSDLLGLGPLFVPDIEELTDVEIAPADAAKGGKGKG